MLVQIMNGVSEEQLNQNCPINTGLQALAWPDLLLIVLQSYIFTTSLIYNHQENPCACSFCAWDYFANKPYSDTT